jgi:hypothetical protein
MKTWRKVFSFEKEKLRLLAYIYQSINPCHRMRMIVGGRIPQWILEPHWDASASMRIFAGSLILNTSIPKQVVKKQIHPIPALLS